MLPDCGRARCPACGRLDSAAELAPLFIVTGASCSGKTDVFPHLARRLRGRAMVFDVDWLIDPMAQQAGESPIAWDAFRAAWLAVAHGVAQNGLPTVLLAPFIPEHLERLEFRRWVGEAHYLVLDCPDDLRRERIEARPAWRARDISEQVAFGRWLRANIPRVVDTSSGTPESTGAEVARWVLDAAGG